MKSQLVLTTLFAAASLGAVESFQLPNGKPPSSPSSSSLQKDGQVNEDIASRYMGFARKQMDQKEDTRDIASRYMGFSEQKSSPLQSSSRPVTTSSWKREVSETETQSRAPSSNSWLDLLNFEVNNQKVFKTSKEIRTNVPSYESYHVTKALIDEWSVALKELDNLREQMARDQYKYEGNLYNFEDSWQ